MRKEWMSETVKATRMNTALTVTEELHIEGRGAQTKCNDSGLEVRERETPRRVPACAIIREA